MKHYNQVMSYQMILWKVSTQHELLTVLFHGLNGSENRISDVSPLSTDL